MRDRDLSSTATSVKDPSVIFKDALEDTRKLLKELDIPLAPSFDDLDPYGKSTKRPPIIYTLPPRDYFVPPVVKYENLDADFHKSIENIHFEVPTLPTQPPATQFLMYRAAGVMIGGLLLTLIACAAKRKKKSRGIVHATGVVVVPGAVQRGLETDRSPPRRQGGTVHATGVVVGPGAVQRGLETDGRPPAQGGPGPANNDPPPPYPACINQTAGEESPPYPTEVHNNRLVEIGFENECSANRPKTLINKCQSKS